MGRRAIAGALLVAVAATGDVRAADEPAVPPRDDVDALVALLSAGPDEPAPDGASPTARVARLIAAGDTRLRPLLAGAWRIAATVPAAADRRDGVRRLVRFLYGAGLPDAPGAWLVETDGAVRVRRIAGDGAEAPERMSVATTADVPVPFEEAVKGARLRAAPRTDAKRLLAALDAGGVAAEEREPVAQAVGEQCAASTALVRDLVRRVEAPDSAPWTATALAWTGRPEAAAPLRARVARLAGEAARSASAMESLPSACCALAHVDADAVVAELGAFEGAAREAALAAVGVDLATRVDLAAIAATGDVAARDRVVAGACRRIVAARGDLRVSAATLSSLAPLLAAHREDGDALAREMLADAARRLFWPRGGAAQPPAGGEDLGPYPSIGTRLAEIAEDMKEGALAFADDRPSLFDLVAAPPRDAAPPLRSSVGGLPGAPPGGDEPLRLTGETFARFLRLTLRNEGTVPRLVDRVALRHGVATLFRGDAYAGPVEGRGVRRLDITLGVLPAARTPVARLIAIQPGQAFSWAIELRQEDRDVELIRVALADTISVNGQPAAARLERFAPTRIK